MERRPDHAQDLGPLLARVGDAVDQLLSAAYESGEEERALRGLGRIFSSTTSAIPDLVAIGGWAVSVQGGTMHSAHGLLVMRTDPILALGQDDVEALSVIVRSEPDYAVAEVSVWLTDPDRRVLLAHLDSAGLRVESVARLIVAALARR